MDCQDRHHDDLAAYALGALPAAEARELESHLAGCEACSERLRWLRPAVDLMPASVPQLQAPEGIKQRLMDVVNEEAAVAPAAAASSPPRARRRWLPSFDSFRPALAGLAGLREQGGLALDLGHDPRLQLGRRGHLRRGHGQRVGGREQVRDLLTAGGTVVEVALERLALVLRHGLEHVRARGIDPAVVLAHTGATFPTPSWARNFFRPSRIRPFTVPTGASSMSAISVCVKPPK